MTQTPARIANDLFKFLSISNVKNENIFFEVLVMCNHLLPISLTPSRAYNPCWLEHFLISICTYKVRILISGFRIVIHEWRFAFYLQIVNFFGCKIFINRITICFKFQIWSKTMYGVNYLNGFVSVSSYAGFQWR